MGSLTGLVCAATKMELETFDLKDAEVIEEGTLYRIPEGIAAVTGVGTPITLLRLVPLLQKFKPQWICTIGIAGAYVGSGLKIGEIVIGETEVFTDLGMETPEDNQEKFGGLIPLADFPFADEAHRAPMPLWIPTWIKSLSRGNGSTVNQCTGTDATGARRRAQFKVDFETMEGAAAALAARAENIPVLEVRAISNFAARRDMRPENIGAALDSLRAFWAEHRGALS